MPRRIITVDLGFGDAGKGSIVDSLVRKYDIPLVARYSGGCQCAHNVVTPEGVHHTFSQFGSGTFNGAITLLMKDAMVDPLRLVKEGEVLVSKGIDRALGGFDGIMHIDERCLVTTPFHAALNQRKEEARGNAKHGSCGVGIGETMAYSLKHPYSALRIGDLTNPKVMHIKLGIMFENMKEEFDNIYLSGAKIPASKSPFGDIDYIDALCWRYQEFTKKVRILPETEALIAHRDVVFEGSQGILLDEDYGFHPYTTWSHVTSKNAVEALKTVGVTDYTTIGIMRSYAHRHGAGPFPTECKLDVYEPHNENNAWQGSFRVGDLDLASVQYALQVNPVDQLAVTHCDAINTKTWPIVTGYEYPYKVIDPQDFKAREIQTNNLITTDPARFRRHRIEKGKVLSFIADFLKVPVGITSIGSIHPDKTYLI